MWTVSQTCTLWRYNYELPERHRQANKVLGDQLTSAEFALHTFLSTTPQFFLTVDMSVSITSLRSLRQKVLRTNVIKSTIRCGSGHHSPSMPPFAQLRPPSVQVSQDLWDTWLLKSIDFVLKMFNRLNYSNLLESAHYHMLLTERS